MIRETVKSRGKAIGTLLILALFIIAARSFDLQNQLRSLLRWIDSLGNWGPLMFILIYILACVLFLPGSLLTLGAGVLFGVMRGAVIVSIASTVGATAAFLVGRLLARDWVAKRIQTAPKFKAIDEAVAVEGWKIVGLLRLSPVFPFSLLNYALGLTRSPTSFTLTQPRPKPSAKLPISGIAPDSLRVCSAS